MKEFQSMTVGELRRKLKEYDDDVLVGFSYPSGDHWRTRLVSTIENVEQAKTTWSSYHDEFKLIESDSESDEDEKRETILLLS